VARIGTEDFGDTAKEYSAETAAALESRTVVTNEKTPGVVGVPAIVPVDKFNVRPAGKWPLVELHV
jgi:hypothetical protein